MSTGSLTILDIVRHRINYHPGQIKKFCHRWSVRELAFFGSILRDEFRPDSDVDVLISFTPDAPWSLFDLITMQGELETMFKRPVDLVEREGLRNPFRKRHIFNNMKVIYERSRA